MDAAAALLFRNELWAIGLTVYQMVAGTLPMAPFDVHALTLNSFGKMLLSIEEAAPTLNTVQVNLERRGVPAEVAAVVARLLSPHVISISDEEVTEAMSKLETLRKERRVAGEGQVSTALSQRIQSVFPEFF